MATAYERLQVARRQFLEAPPLPHRESRARKMRLMADAATSTAAFPKQVDVGTSIRSADAVYELLGAAESLRLVAPDRFSASQEGEIKALERQAAEALPLSALSRSSTDVAAGGLAEAVQGLRLEVRQLMQQLTDAFGERFFSGLVSESQLFHDDLQPTDEEAADVEHLQQRIFGAPPIVDPAREGIFQRMALRHQIDAASGQAWENRTANQQASDCCTAHSLLLYIMQACATYDKQRSSTPLPAAAPLAAAEAAEAPSLAMERTITPRISGFATPLQTAAAATRQPTETSSSTSRGNQQSPHRLTDGRSTAAASRNGSSSSTDAPAAPSAMVAASSSSSSSSQQQPVEAAGSTPALKGPSVEQAKTENFSGLLGCFGFF